jgi:hypothetical protein
VTAGRHHLVRVVQWLRLLLVLPCLLVLACLDVWKYPRQPRW